MSRLQSLTLLRDYAAARTGIMTKLAGRELSWATLLGAGTSQPGA